MTKRIWEFPKLTLGTANIQNIKCPPGYGTINLTVYSDKIRGVVWLGIMKEGGITKRDIGWIRQINTMPTNKAFHNIIVRPGQYLLINFLNGETADDRNVSAVWEYEQLSDLGEN